MSGTHTSVHGFGDYELSKGERLILRGGRVIPLQARPFDLLLYLIENRDRVISRDELLRTVWKGVRVNEQALRFAVHAVRRAIGDTGHAQRVIRTVRGNGLQFIAAVRTVDRRSDLGVDKYITHIDHSFLGRESFIRSVDRSLAESALGRPSTLLATGETGIGKTTALLRAATLASDRGFRVGTARCTGGTAEAPALWPWTQALRRVLEEESKSSLVETIRNGAEEVAWLLPEMRELISQSGITSTSDARASQYRLFDSVSTLVRRLALRAPVAIFIDDLHEADQLSLALFRHLSADLINSRSMLFAAFRSPGGGDQRYEETVAAMLRVRGTQLVTFTGLGEREVALIAESLAGAKPSTEAVRSILAKTNGNPFFVLQILKLLENDGRLSALTKEGSLEYSIPREVRETIRRQIERLPIAVRELLEVAAVIEEEFSSSLLARALNTDSEHVLLALEMAIESGICVSEDEGFSYRFAHALVREAISDSLAVAERAEYHGRIAKAMEDGAGTDPGALSADIAHHYAASYPAPTAARAIRFLRLAARWDVDRAAFDSAAGQLGRAKDLLERLQPDDLAQRCELCLEQGSAYGHAGSRENSRKLLMEAYRLAVRCNRSDLAAQAALAFAPDLLAIETGVYDEELVELLEGALERLDHDAMERPRLLARLAVALHWSGEPRERLRALVEQALARAEELEDRDMQSFVGMAGSLALYSVESPHASLYEARSNDRADSSTVLMRSILRITALWQLGQVRNVEIEIEAFEALVKRTRRPSAGWYVGMLRATMALMRGRYEAAREMGESFLRAGLAFDDRNALHSFALQRAMAAVDLGGLDEIEPAVVGMASTFPRVEGWRAGTSYLKCELGKLSEAREIFEAAIGQGTLDSYPRNSWFGTIGSLALACRAIGTPETVERLYALWARFSGQLAVVGFSSFCWGSADRFLGVLAGLIGRWEDAELHFERAVGVNRAIGAGPALAHTWADRGATLDRRTSGSGRESWDLALQQARDLGMKNLERRILSDGS